MKLKKTLNFTKNSIGQSEALNYETLSKKARFLRRILTYNLPENYLDIQAEILDNISKEEIDQLAKKHLTYENMVIVVVGDSSNLYPQLKKLGYDIIPINETGIIPSQTDSTINQTDNQSNNTTIIETKNQNLPLYVEADNFELAYREASKKLGYSKESFFIYNETIYTTENKIIKPLKELDLKTLEKDYAFVIEELFFKNNSSTLSLFQKEILVLLAEKINAINYTITITGLSNKKENEILANERAKVCYEILKENGVENLTLSNKTKSKLSYFDDDRATYLNKGVLFQIQ